MPRSSRRIAILVLFSLLLGVGNAWAVTPPKQLDADTVKAALKVRTPEDRAFVDRVVAMVEAKTLPRSLFDSALLWARKKPVYQFQYFKMAITILAERRNIDLD